MRNAGNTIRSDCGDAATVTDGISAIDGTAVTDGIYVTREQLLNLKKPQTASIARQTRSPSATFFGDVLSALKGHGIEFADIRPYQPGDEVRHIDWRSTARTGSPYTREYIKETQQSVYLAVDQRLNMFFGSGQEFKSVCAARLATMVAWASARRGLKLGATVIGAHSAVHHATVAAQDKKLQQVSTVNTQPSNHYCSSIRTGPAKKTTLALINELTIANNSLSATCPADTQATNGLHRLIDLTCTHMQPRSTVYLISDFHGLTADTEQAICKLGRRCTLVMIMISDTLEDTLEVSGTIGVSDGSHHSVLQMTTAKRDRYLQDRRTFHDSARRSADRSGATLLHHVLSGNSHSDVLL
jgi:hypothetical protein